MAQLNYQNSNNQNVKVQFLSAEYLEMIEPLPVLATDFAILTGVKPYKVDVDKIMFSACDNYAPYWTSNIKGVSGKVAARVSDENASKYVNATTKSIGGRPALDTSNMPDISTLKPHTNNNYMKEFELGEYPQTVDFNISRLADENQIDTSKKIYTGKSYTVMNDNWGLIPEFIYNGQKYVQLIYSGNTTWLSSGKITMSHIPKIIWIKVEPIVWVKYNDDCYLSRDVLFAGYINKGQTVSDFNQTDMRKFLDTFEQEMVLENDINLTTPEKEKVINVPTSNNFNFNLELLTEEDIIRHAIDSNTSVFLHGASSEGKSARVKQIDPDCEIIYLRNASPDSLNGKSVYNSNTNSMMDLKPTWLVNVEKKCEAEPDKLHIIFFDEITNALPSIQGIAFNIILDKEVNGKWKLPENARIVAAGNELSDSIAANKLAEPLFNRFAHVYIKTTTKSWLKWASENNIHPAIYSYILYRNGTTLRSPYTGTAPNADPRKWEMASKVLYQTKNPNMLRALVGKEITKEFVKFCQEPVITLEDVLNNNYTKEDIKNLNLAQKHATVLNLSQVNEANVKTVREFVRKLGEEYRAIFDTLWSRDDNHRLEIIAELEMEHETEVKSKLSVPITLKRTKKNK